MIYEIEKKIRVEQFKQRHSKVEKKFEITIEYYCRRHVSINNL